MARLSYLIRRGATYYARMRVPLDLVKIVGREEHSQSLRTKDEHEAKRRLWPILDGWGRLHDDLRSRRELTADDKAEAVWGHYTGTVDRYEHDRGHLPTDAEIDAVKNEIMAKADRGELVATDPLAILDATSDVHTMQASRSFGENSRQMKLKMMRRHLVVGETALIEDDVDDYLDRNKLRIDRASEDRRDIARQMMRAEIEGLERTVERDRGDYGGAPKDPIVKPAIGAAREAAAPGESIMDLFAIYERENPKGISQDTFNQARRDIGTFLDTIGSTSAVRRIDKKAVRDWKALLVRYPVKASETNAFAGMKIAQIVQANEKVGKPVLSPRTVNRYLSSLGAFCNWLVAHGYLGANPCSDMFLAKKKGSSSLPFTSAQLTALFSSPLFTGCRSDDQWRFIAEPGNVMIRDHRFWVPLIMLFSGARPGEIAQLNIADVRQENGTWIMHVTEEGEGGKTVKTAGSMRVLPVHSELIRLGLIRHYDRMKAEGQARLFPEAERNSRGQWIADTSREFGRYLTRLGMKKGRGLSLYSFRHGATDALRRAGHLDEQFGFILGHTKGTMTGRYGTLPQGMLKHRVELIEAIGYPDLDLSHL